LGDGRSIPIPLFILLNSALHPAGEDVDDGGDPEGVDCSATVLGGVEFPVMMAATTADLFCAPELRLVDGRCRPVDRLNVEFSFPGAFSALDPPKNPGRRRIEAFRLGFGGTGSAILAGQTGLADWLTGDLALFAESRSFLVPRGWIESSP